MRQMFGAVPVALVLIVAIIVVMAIVYVISQWVPRFVWRRANRGRLYLMDESRFVRVRTWGKRKVGITVAGDKAVNCFYCDGAGCKFCSGRGWIPKDGP